MTAFSDFTNLYSLSKTLRFELKPVGQTFELLNEDFKEIRKDKIREEVYQKIVKPKLDELHKDFISQALENIQLDLTDDLAFVYQQDKKEFENIQKKLIKQIAKHLQSFQYKFEDFTFKWAKFLWDKKVFDLIKYRFWQEIFQDTDFEEIKWKTIEYILDKYFKGFFTYLSTFNENRKNFYKDDGKFGRIATRIVKDNLPKFLENVIAYENFKDKIQLTDEEKSIFDIHNFSKFLSQKWIDTYNELVWKINSKINQYNQTHNLKWKNKIKSLQILYKQILQDSTKADIFNFASNVFTSDEELLQALKKFVEAEKQVNPINEILKNFSHFDLSWIWLKKSNLRILSNRYLQNWSVLENLLDEKQEIYNLEEIKNALNQSGEDIFKEKFELVGEDNFEKFINLFLQDLQTINEEKAWREKMLDKTIFQENFQKTKEQKQVIKDYLDIVLEIERNLNLFDLTTGQGENKKEIQVENKDADFYNLVQQYLDLEIPKFYNAVRNYLTKKPWNKEKFKLNFDNSTFLDGWDKNKEKDNYWIILRKFNEEKQDWDYFLLVMKKWFHHMFDESKNPAIYQVGEDYFEKMEYKLLPWPNKMLPKVIFSKKWINEFAPSKEILEIREKESFKQWENFSLEDLHKWIDFMKESLQKYPDWKDFDFKFQETSKYNNIKDFYYDIEKQGYKISFKKVDYQKILDLVEKKQAYLFQIWNKDFSPYSKWNPNLHTIYFKSLFEKENFENWPVYKLNWQAEVFFRPKSNTEIKKRILKDWTEIIEHKRYLENKILFHVPITLNFVNKQIKKINDMVKEHIKQNEMKIIWIDRWEKHLLYVVMIDEKGNILEKKSLNCIINQLPNGEEKEVCYIEKLIEKEKARDEERKSWDEIETIKELKEWYISQIVSYLVKLAVENNAIIVLEDLNWGFKRSRQKIERQVYQKFETALAKKLNYIIFKDKAPNEIAGKYKALQLAPEVNQYQDIYSQTWILFFTQAAYTSTTCPSCGFRKNIYPKFENIQKTLDFIKNMEIHYKDGAYYFTYEIPQRKDSKWNKLKKTKFTISTQNQERIRIYKDKQGHIQKETFNMTKFFDDLFEKHWIPKTNIKNNILVLWKSLEQSFFKSFIFGLNLLLQLRNSDSSQDLDYIQCPHCGFDSRKSSFITNWDENWAYNIARKWKMIIDKIRNWEKSLGISLVEWDNYQRKSSEEIGRD